MQVWDNKVELNKNMEENQEFQTDGERKRPGRILLSACVSMATAAVQPCKPVFSLMIRKQQSLQPLPQVVTPSTPLAPAGTGQLPKQASLWRQQRDGVPFTTGCDIRMWHQDVTSRAEAALAAGYTRTHRLFSASLLASRQTS